MGNPDAQQLADWLVEKASVLGIQAVIYNRRVWGYGRWNWRPYSGVNAHIDHVHVSMQIRAANEGMVLRNRALIVDDFFRSLIVDDFFRKLISIL